MQSSVVLLNMSDLPPVLWGVGVLPAALMTAPGASRSKHHTLVLGCTQAGQVSGNHRCLLTTGSLLWVAHRVVMFVLSVLVVYGSKGNELITDQLLSSATWVTLHITEMELAFKGTLCQKCSFVFVCKAHLTSLLIANTSGFHCMSSCVYANVN